MPAPGYAVGTARVVGVACWALGIMQIDSKRKKADNFTLGFRS
jgi:hypothetical protein